MTNQSTKTLAKLWNHHVVTLPFFGVVTMYTFSVVKRNSEAGNSKPSSQN